MGGGMKMSSLFVTDNGTDFRCLKCNIDTIGEIGHICEEEEEYEED